MPNYGMLFAALIVLAIAAFFLGWDIAESRERKAKYILDANLKLAIRQKNQLSQWVRQNWPNEYAAMQRGYHEGYQQGVIQSPYLDEETTT